MLVHRINEDILNDKIRIVGGESNEVIDFDSALEMAYNQDLDLVEMSEKDGVSICKIMNYSKFLYEQKKSKKVQKKSTLKEIKLGCNIADHDIMVSAKKCKNILEDGDRVKVIVIFKGRQVVFANEQGSEVLDKFLSYFEDDYINVVKQPKLEGNMFTMQVEKKN